MYKNKNNKTLLVLKTPKTTSSVRTVYIPKTTAKILHQWKTTQEDQINAIGKEYQNYDLMMAFDNGRPIESKFIGRDLDALIKKHGLPDVDFHSLRHTSTSVKLVISKGDIKSVQGDTGHSQAKMVTDTYAEIFDSRRKVNARKFDETFFANELPENCPDDVIDQLISGLINNPRVREKFMKAMEAATL